MPSFASVMKNEIRRLARREAKALVTPLIREKIALKGALRGLKKRLAALDKQNQALAAQIKTLSGIQDRVQPAKDTNLRITAKGIRSLRRKLRLTQTEFARLAKVSPLTVFHWEKKTGALRLRGNTGLVIDGLRKLGAREARLQLETRKPGRAKR